MHHVLQTSARLSSPATIPSLHTYYLGCVCLLMSLVVGCDSKPTPPAEQKLPYEGVTVRLAVPKGWGFRDHWELQLSDWAASTGGKAELVETDMTDGSGPLLKSDERAQLVVFPWTRRGELLAGKELRTLPTEVIESQLYWNDLFQGLHEKQGNSGAGKTLVPLSAPVLVCYYRADLLEKAGRQPPATWAEYQVLLDDLATWAPGLKAAEPWSPEFRATMFIARALPYVKHSGHYSTFFDIENGNPFIDSPGFVKALEATQQAIKKLPPEVFQYNPVTCRNLVLSGEAALAIGLETGPDSIPLNVGATAPLPAGKSAAPKRAEGISIGFCRVPGASEVYNPTLNSWVVGENAAPNYATLTGFAGLCAGIPVGTDDKTSAAAVNLLSKLLLETTDTNPPGSVSLCREGQVQDAGTWVGKDLGGSESGRYVAIVAKSLRDRQQVGELPVLGHAEFRASLTKGVTAALEQGTTAAEALGIVAREWKEILKKLGQDNVRASYRSAMGLTNLEEL